MFILCDRMMENHHQVILRMNAAISNWHPFALYLAVVQVLESRFGGPLPNYGVIAGQAVSSAILEVLEHDVQGNFKDIDWFLHDSLGSRVKDYLISEAANNPKTSHAYTTLAAQVCDAPKRDMSLSSLKKNAKGLSISASAGMYDEIHVRSQEGGCYTIESVHEAESDFPLNLVLINHSMGSTAENITHDIISGFDLNITQAGLDLKKGKVVWTEHFEQFLFRPELKVVNFTTPTTTAIRLLEKLEKIPGLECDVDANLRLLSQARWLSWQYESRSLTQQPIVHSEDFKPVPDGEESQPIGIPTYRSERFTKLDGTEGVLYTVIDGEQPDLSVKMPGVRLHSQKKPLWEKHQQVLSKHFTIDEKPTHFKKIYKRLDEEGSIINADVKVDKFTLYNVVPNEDFTEAWHSVFTKDLVESKEFFSLINRHDYRASGSGGLESIYESMDRINAIAKGRGKEPKAIKSLIGEYLAPRLVAIADQSRERLEVIIDMDEKQEQSGEPWPKALADNHSENCRAYKELLGQAKVYAVVLKALLSDVQDAKWQVLTPKKLEEYIKLCLEEPPLLGFFAMSSDQREHGFRNYRMLRKKRELSLMADGLPDVSKLRPLELLSLPKDELLHLIEKDNEIQRKMAVTRLIPEMTVDGVTIRELTSAYELKEQGRREGHCVGGYFRRVESGECVILSLKSESGDKSTAEIYVRQVNKNDLIKFDIIQHQGKFNKSPNQANDDALKGWLERANQALGNTRSCNKKAVDPAFSPLVKALYVGKRMIANQEQSLNEKLNGPDLNIYEIWDRYSDRTILSRSHLESGKPIYDFKNNKSMVPLTNAQGYLKFLKKRQDKLTPSLLTM